MSVKKQRKYNKVTPKTLDRPAHQRRMLQAIILSGEEAGCWEGSCSRSTYHRFIKENPTWQERVDRAIAQYQNRITLANPGLRNKAIQLLITRVNDGEATVTELIKLLEFLPENELWTIPE